MTTDTTTGLIVGKDGLARPAWAATDPLLREYYDTEWGIPVTDEAGLFERLALEAFQSGLSWRTVLRKRPAFRSSFAGFDVDTVAAFTEADVERLLADEGIIRNRLKIETTIANARAIVELRQDGGLPALIWSRQPPQTPVPVAAEDVPSTSELSLALANDLKSRGLRFVGPVTMQALLAAVGVIDLHQAGSHRRGCSGLWTRTGRRKTRPRLPG